MEIIESYTEPAQSRGYPHQQKEPEGEEEKKEEIWWRKGWKSRLERMKNWIWSHFIAVST